MSFVLAFLINVFTYTAHTDHKFPVTVTIGWDVAKGATFGTTYEVVLDGTTVGTTPQTTFPVVVKTEGVHWFGVKAHDTNGKISTIITRTVYLTK